MTNLILENHRAKIEVLNINNYKFIEPVALEKDIIKFSPSDISTPEKFKTYVDEALTQLQNNTAIPFIIFDKEFNSYAGSTRMAKIDYKNEVLEIGWTWLSKSFQGTGLNKAVKQLILHNAFEVLNFKKVDFRIDERNIASRKAVEKLGAKLEGILRENVLMIDGFRRNTCCYGITTSEWKILKQDVLKEYYS